MQTCLYFYRIYDTALTCLFKILCYIALFLNCTIKYINVTSALITTYIFFTILNTFEDYFIWLLFIDYVITKVLRKEVFLGSNIRKVVSFAWTEFLII